MVQDACFTFRKVMSAFKHKDFRILSCRFNTRSRALVRKTNWTVTFHTTSRVFGLGTQTIQAVSVTMFSIETTGDGFR